MDHDHDQHEQPRQAAVFSRAFLWFATMLTVLLNIGFYHNFVSTGNPAHGMALAGGVAVSVCLVLVIVDSARFWWAGRFLAGVVFLLMGAYLLGAVLERAVGPQPGMPGGTALTAVAAFLLVGIPALTYFLWGTVDGPMGGQSPEDASLSDLATQALLLLSFVGGLIAFVVLAVRSFIYLGTLAGAG